MFTQFFCNYLLNEKIITAKQVIDGLQAMSNTRTKLGVLAMNAGYMTATEIEQAHAMQTHKDMRFGDLCVEMGFLTNEQVDELLSMQTPEYLQFGQAIIDLKYLTNAEFERVLSEYKEKYSIEGNELEGTSAKVAELLSIMIHDYPEWNNEEFSVFISLFINNLIRFVGKDFTIGNPETTLAKTQPYITYQGVNGEISFSTYLLANEKEMIEFAHRYIDESASDVDEYVLASTCDFMNLHNGLFTVNLSNESGIELSLTPPENMDADNVPFDNFNKDNCLILPFVYPFGCIRLVLYK